MSHTKVPWKLIDEPRNHHYRDAPPGSYERAGQHCQYIAGPKHDSDFVADIITSTRLEGDGNARLIVRAVNAHNDLLAACEALLEYMPCNEHGQRETPSDSGLGAYTQAKAAIAKAKGETPCDATKP